MRINHVKLTKDGTFGVSYTRRLSAESEPIEVVEVYKDPVHDDLRKSFKALRIHYAFLIGMVEEDQVKVYLDLVKENDQRAEEIIDQYTVTGWSQNEKRGFVITGYHTQTKIGRPVIVNTPFTIGDEDYEHIDDLTDKIFAARKETLSYINGKRQSEQISLFEPEKVDKLIIDHPEEKYDETKVVNMNKKKTGRSKKVAQTANTPSGEVAIQ